MTILTDTKTNLSLVVEGTSQLEAIPFASIWEARTIPEYGMMHPRYQAIFQDVADTYEASGLPKDEAALAAFNEVAHTATVRIIALNLEDGESRSYADFLDGNIGSLTNIVYSLTDALTERVTGSFPEPGDDLPEQYAKAYHQDGGSLVTFMHTAWQQMWFDANDETPADNKPKPAKKNAKRKAASKARKASRRK
jgi:hypothetical protein